MAKLNKRQIDLNVSRLKGINIACYDLASKKIEDGKVVLIQDLNNHPVTKEIEEGEASLNVSGTLGGKGNLFSFIGFQKGSEPIQIVRSMINKIRVIKRVKLGKPIRNGFSVSVGFFAPSISDFEKNTPMPWARGRSWLLGIERGISGFSFFVSKALSGRSGGGIQGSEKVSSGAFRNTSYFSRMYSAFFRRVGSSK